MQASLAWLAAGVAAPHASPKPMEMRNMYTINVFSNEYCIPVCVDNYRPP